MAMPDSQSTYDCCCTPVVAGHHQVEPGIGRVLERRVGNR